MSGGAAPISCEVGYSGRTEGDTIHKTSSILADAGKVRWQRCLDTALKKIEVVSKSGIDRMSDVVKKTRGKDARGFTALMRKSQQSENSEEDERLEDGDDAGSAEQTRNILVELREKNTVTLDEINNCLKGQIVTMFEQLWDIVYHKNGTEKPSDDTLNDEGDEDGNGEGGPKDDEDKDRDSYQVEEIGGVGSQPEDSENLSSDRLSLSVNSDPSTPSGFRSSKRRKLLGEDGYQVLLSGPLDSTIDQSLMTTTNDIQASLIPLFAAYIGLPVQELIGDTLRTLPDNSVGLNLTLQMMRDSFLPVPINSPSLTDLCSISFIPHWVEMAARSVVSEPQFSSFVLRTLLALVQQLNYLHSIRSDSSTRDSMSEKCHSIAEHVKTCFICPSVPPLLQAPESLQRLIILLIVQSRAVSFNNHISDSALVTCLLRSLSFPHDLISLFIDASLSCTRIPLQHRIHFIREVISASRNHPSVVNRCQSHFDRLQLEIEIELDRAFCSSPVKVSNLPSAVLA